MRQGNLDKYLELLRKTLAHCEPPENWRPLLAARQLEILARKAHSLKGVAATLGLQSVREAAEAFDTACRRAAQEAGPGGRDTPPDDDLPGGTPCPRLESALETLIAAFGRTFGDLRQLFQAEPAEEGA